MNHAALSHWFACLCPWLMVVWLLQCLARGCGLHTRGWLRLLLCGLLGAGVLAVRVEGLALAGWLAGLNANWSLPFTGLLAAAVGQGAITRPWLCARDWRVGWGFGLAAGLVLYPAALGWGGVDPYSWGWQFSGLFVASAGVTVLLLWKGCRFGVLLLVAISAYHLRLLESTNYWDYLLDPVYCLVSAGALVWSLLPRRMNLAFQRSVDFWLGVPLCALLSGLEWLRPKPARTGPPRRILVILLSEMGSLVLARSMFERLKQRYPEAALHVLVFARNREVLDLMELVPATHVLTLDDRSLRRFAADALKLWFTLRRLRCEVVLDCELFARISSILAYLSGARVRVGFHRHTQEGLYRGSFINRPVQYNPYRHISQQFLTLVEAIESAAVPAGKQTVPPTPEAPSLVGFAAAELEQVREKLHADFPALRDKSLVLVYPGGGLLPMRAWPFEHYLRLCATLLKEGHAVGIIGLKTDQALGRALVAQCPAAHCVDLTGYTHSVRHLLALFHRASLLVTNDGGPGQLAALTPVPAIIFFGPETPVLYGPLGRNTLCFHQPLPCSPCLTAYNHRTSPCDGDNQCLRQISPERVLAAARQILERPAAAGGRAKSGAPSHRAAALTP